MTGCANVAEYIMRAQWPPRSPAPQPIENAWALVARQASLRQPKTLEELNTCSVCGVDGDGEYCTTLLTRWMRAYGSYGSYVVLTLATSYGQLATITPLR